MSGCLGKAVKYTLMSLGLMALLIVLGAIMNQSGTRTVLPASVRTASSAGLPNRITAGVTEASLATATASSGGIAPSFQEICDTDLSDAQQEEIGTALAGKQVVGWTGKVYDVKYDGTSYTVLVDMVQGFISARQIELLGVTRDVAIALNAGQVITFDGTIQSIDSFMGNLCNPINIVEAVIR